MPNSIIILVTLKSLLKTDESRGPASLPVNDHRLFKGIPEGSAASPTVLILAMLFFNRPLTSLTQTLLLTASTHEEQLDMSYML